MRIRSMLPSVLLVATALAGVAFPIRAASPERFLVFLDSEDARRAIVGLSEWREAELPQAAVLELTAEERARLAESGVSFYALPSADRLELASGETVRLRGHAFDGSRWTSADEKRPLLVTFDGAARGDWSRSLIEAGAEIVSAVPPAGFFVRADAAAAERLWSLPGVAVATEVEPRWKIEPTLARAVLEWVAGETLVVEIVVHAGAETGRVESLLAGHRAELGRRNSLGRTVLRAEVAAGGLAALAALPEVQWIEGARRARAMNDSIRVLMQTERQHFSANQAFYNPIYGIGVDGSSQLVAIADTGMPWSVGPTHEMFAGPSKIQSYYAPDPACGVLGDLFSHGVGVADTLAGDSLGELSGLFGSPNSFDGVAFASRLHVQDVFDNNPVTEGDFCENLDVPSEILKPAFLDGARVHNNSWGHTFEAATCAAPRGSYSLRSQELDAHLKLGTYRDSVVVFAAGNFGTWPWPWPDPCYASATPSLRPRTVSDEGHAKNVITVGASRDETSRNIMYTYSSRGPTNDCSPAPGVACTTPGRVKPDLVAPGSTVIHSAESSGSNTYCPLDPWTCAGGYFGTSFAAPAVSGAAALVRDYFAKGKYPASAPSLVGAPSSALVKAMLVNASVFLNDASAYAATVIEGGTSSTYPNYDQGYGRPALDSVLEPAGFRKLKVYQDSTTQLDTGDTWTVTPIFKSIWGGTCNTLRVTLAWTDEPAALGINPVLVNDLDLEVTYRNVTWRGNHGLTGNLADRLNNVEDVFIPLGAMPLSSLQKPVIRVRGFRVMSATSQPFAVVATYGPCFDNTPCPQTPAGGCYRGPGDVVPGTKTGLVPGCNEQTYSTQECLSCGQSPWPTCKPPHLPIIKPGEIFPHE